MSADRDRDLLSSREERRNQLLQDTGKLLIFIAADHGMPICPEKFKQHTLRIASKTGISTDRLVEVYKFLQQESSSLSFDKKPDRGGVGFKQGENTE